MIYNIRWTDDDHIALHLMLTGDVSWGDLAEIREILTQRLDEAPGQVDILFEVHISMLLPIRFVANREFIDRSPVFSHPHARRLLVIGANPYFSGLYAIFAAVYPAEMVRRIVLVPSLEYALQAVKENLPR
jgi:hypothetical protein